MKQRLQKLFLEIKASLHAPTLKQKESYGRMAHTLSSANFIGAATVMFAQTHATPHVIGRIAALIFWGVVLFLAGAILSKGE